MPARRRPPTDPKEPPVPLPDPEAILRENRRLQRISRPDPTIARLVASQQTLPVTPARSRTDQHPPATPNRIRTEPSNLPPLPETSDDSPLSSLPPSPTRKQSSNTPFPTMADETTKPNDPSSDLMKAIVESQLASNKRMEKFEEFMMKMVESKETNTSTSTPADTKPSNGIELAKFRTSDGPIYKGPYRDPEPFLLWYSSLKTFFRTKGVTSDSDRITIVGNFLEEPNAHAFYEGGFDDFIKGSWKDFLNSLFSSCLPADWKDRLYEKAQHLKMSQYEDFITYSTRARGIQILINFHDIRLNDYQLATFVEYGMVEELKTAVRLWGFSKFTKDFAYHTFENQCETLYTSLVASHAIVKKTRLPAASATSFNTSNSYNRSRMPTANTSARLSDEEFTWKIHSYRDSIGQCHFCKGWCGSEHRECKGPYVREKVVFPPGYVAPPKPANYIPPRAKSSPPATRNQAGRSYQAPAGRPAASYAKVAAASEFPDLDEVAVAALAALDEELDLAEAEGTGGRPT